MVVFLLFLTTMSHTLYIQLGANKWLLQTVELQFEEALTCSHNRKPRKWFRIAFICTLIVSSKEFILDWEYKFVHVYVFKCNMHGCVCVKARGQYQVSSQLLSTLFFDTGSLTSHGTCWLSWTGWPSRPKHPPLSISLVSSLPLHPDVRWVLGIQTQPRMIVQQALYWQSHLPSSGCIFFYLVFSHLSTQSSTYPVNSASLGLVIFGGVALPQRY